MLELALKHKEKLQALYMDTMFEEKYKYYNACSYYNQLDIPDKSIGWNNIQFASIKEKEVLGFINFDVCRDVGIITSVTIINFSNDKLTFGKDVYKAFEKILKRPDISKISFSVIPGNPMEKTYDTLMKKYKGSVVGIKRNHLKLCDGNIADLKMYEIFTKHAIKCLYERGRTI